MKKISPVRISFVLVEIPFIADTVVLSTSSEIETKHKKHHFSIYNN